MVPTRKENVKMTTLKNGELLVSKDDITSKVELTGVTSDLMVTIHVYDEYSSEILTFDPLNETLIDYLKDEGYIIIN